MRNVISFMHISLDGFVATRDGALNWVTVDAELFDYVGNRINKGDTALYGRVTYEMMESYWPTAGDSPNASKHDIEHAAWYKQVRKVVLSNTLKAASDQTVVIGDNLVERIHQLKQEEGEDILIFGSPKATHSLLQHGLVDGFWLFVNPVILGEGVPLFAGIKDKMNLTLVNTHRLGSGVVELNYSVNR